MSVKANTSQAGVQGLMNAAIGQDYWVEDNYPWQLLLDARKNFVLGYLREQNINPKEFKTLEKALRIKHQGALEKAFATLFLDFCRRGNWEDAAGKDDSWIEIKGMAAWHVRKTIIALSGMKGNSGTPSDLFTTPFDPVRDAAGNKSFET